MINLFVAGTPKAQPRPKAARRGGFIQIYTPPTAKDWKDTVKAEFEKYKDTFPKHEALGISLRFYFERPVSHLKKDGQLRKGINLNHVQKPDFDNLAKAVVDAMGDAKVWHDDCQIVTSNISKEWSEYSGCYITVWKEGL